MILGVSTLSTSFSSQSTNVVVKEVLNVLTPRIMTLISEALSAQQAAKQQALLEQQRQEEARRQAALLEQQRLEEQRRQQALQREEEARRQAALLAQQQAQQQPAGDLTSLFGDGKTHYVKVEVPGVFKEEYNLA